MLSEGGIVYEVFIRAQGPNQWFPVGPMVVKQEWQIISELWAAEEPLKTAGLKMYPGLSRPPAFGKVEYGYRKRDESKKVSEAQIREAAGKMNPFDDVVLLTRDADSGPPLVSWMDKIKKIMNPYE